MALTSNPAILSNSRILPKKELAGSARLSSTTKWCRVSACRTIERWAAGGMPVLPKRGAHGRPRYDLATCRKSAPQTDTPDTGDTGHHFVGLEGERGVSWVSAREGRRSRAA